MIRASAAASPRTPLDRGIAPAGVAAALGLLLLVFAAKHVLTALVFPPFTGHDEVAHYGYVRTIALEGRLPRLTDPLPPELSAYRAYALDWQTGPGYQYTAVHPPLYYALMAPLVRADPDAPPEAHLYAIRLAGVWIGAATVLLSYALARALFPADAFLAVTVPTLVALQPQVSYEAAIVNNDALGIAAASLILWLLVRALRTSFDTRRSVYLGLAVGAGLLAKSTTLVLLPVIIVAILITCRAEWATALRAAGAVAVPAVALSAGWYAFLYRTYGDLSGLGQLAVIQGTWNHPAGPFFELLFSTSFLAERFKETWGEFGWRRAPIHAGLLWTIGLVALTAAIGLARWAVAAAGGAMQGSVERPERWQWCALAALLLTCVGFYLAVVQFGTRFVLTQARYFFPAAPAAAVLAAMGLRHLTPAALRPACQAALFLVLLIMNLVIYTQAVIPAWLFPR